MSDATALAISATVFLLTLVGLVAARVRSNGRFEVKTSDLLAPVLLVGLILLVTGKVEKLTLGDFSISAAVADASRKSVEKSVKGEIELHLADMPRSIQFDPTNTYDSSEVPKEGCEGLNFRLGDEYDVARIKEYLNVYRSLKYMIINDSEEKFWGFADLRGISKFSDEDFGFTTKALTDSNVRFLRGLPGFVAASEAIKPDDSRRKVLRSMSRLKVVALPVLDKETFLGVVDRQVLATNLLVDIAVMLEL